MKSNYNYYSSLSRICHNVTSRLRSDNAKTSLEEYYDAFSGCNVYISHIQHWFIFFLITLPYIASAQSPNTEPVNTVLNNFLALLTVLIQILIVSAFLVFGWGVVRFMMTSASGDAKKISESKQILLWGIIGIAVLTSLYGIILFLKTYIGVPDNPIIQAPKFTLSLTSPII